MKGLDFYASRADKAYSLVDCISMDTMRQMGLTEVLTNDHHCHPRGVYPPDQTLTTIGAGDASYRQGTVPGRESAC